MGLLKRAPAELRGPPICPFMPPPGRKKIIWNIRTMSKQPEMGNWKAEGEGITWLFGV